MSSEEGVENVTGFIEKDGNVTLEVADIGSYSEVLGYDDDTGSLDLPIKARITNETCLLMIMTSNCPPPPSPLNT